MVNGRIQQWTDYCTEIDAMGSTDRKNNSGKRTSENIDVVEELVSSQQDAPGTRRTVRHFEHKKNNIIVNLTFPYWKLLFFDTSFYLLTFQNRAANFVEMCNVYANLISMINSVKVQS